MKTHIKNKYSYIFIAFSFLLLLCMAAIFKDDPFSTINLSSLAKGNAKIINEATEDCLLVTKGGKPKNAKFDTKAPLPSDGGTTYYKGNGYKLTILKRLSSFEGLRGYIYGPIIIFDKKVAFKNSNKIQFLRFYTTKQLRKLMKK